MLGKTESSDQISHSVVSDSLRPHESRHSRPPCPSPTPGVHPNSRPSSWWAIQPSHPLLSPFPPAPNPSQHQSLFQWVNSSHEVAKVLKSHKWFQELQSFFFICFCILSLGGMVLKPCVNVNSQLQWCLDATREQTATFFYCDIRVLKDPQAISCPVPFHASQNGCDPKVYKQ